MQKLRPSTELRAPSVARLDAAVRSLLPWYERTARDLPWRHTRDPYAIWISEVMLQQTQVATVIPFWNRWMKLFPDVARLAAAPPDRVLKAWEGLGYYSRARNLQASAIQILQQHAGRFPQSEAELRALPGVGPYTAGAIRSIAFNQPAPIVDGNIVRVLSRLFGCAAHPGEPRGRKWFWQVAGSLVARAAQQEVPHPEACSHLNQSLMELGATVCQPRQPACTECPLAPICMARRKGWQDQLPVRPNRPITIDLRMAAFIVAKGGKYLVCRRAATPPNALLWEFPSVLLDKPDACTRSLGRNAFGLGQIPSQPEFIISHTITRHRIRLEVYRAHLSDAPSRAGKPGVWRSLVEIGELPLPSAHRRIFHHLRQNPDPPAATTDRSSQVNGKRAALRVC